MEGIQSKGSDLRNDRVGESSLNKSGSKMTIVEYNNTDNIVVEFYDNKYRTNTTYYHFKKGAVYCPYDRSVCGVGFIGDGGYKSRINGKPNNIYNMWVKVIERCYSNKVNSHKDCIVCDEWHNFQNFARWYEDNYYEVKNEKMNLDKDILIKGNKVYSPETCIFVPKRINTLFVKQKKKGGSTCPIGVSWSKRDNIFYSRCRILENGKSKILNLGSFTKELDAFMAYKKFKEKYIVEVANEYKENIPEKLYRAMINYKVEVGD